MSLAFNTDVVWLWLTGAKLLAFNIDVAYMSLPNRDNYFQPWPVGLCCQPSNPHKQNRCSVVQTIRINRMQLIKDFNFCKILLIFIPFLIDIPNCNSYGFVNDKHTMHVPKKKKTIFVKDIEHHFFFFHCVFILLTGLSSSLFQYFTK